jgi:hypothetical protein
MVCWWGWVLVHSGQQQNGHLLSAFLQTKNIKVNIKNKKFVSQNLTKV